MMGHADLLVRRIEALPRPQRMAVEQLVDALAAEANRTRNPADIDRILAEARAASTRMRTEEIDREVAAMRADWNDRGWDSKP